MNNKKKYTPEVKERLAQEIGRFVPQTEFLKQAALRLELPYSSVRTWLSSEVDRAPGFELLTKAAERFPLIDWYYVFTGRTMTQVGDNVVVVQEPKTEYGGTAELEQLRIKYINCLETNATLTTALAEAKRKN